MSNQTLVDIVREAIELHGDRDTEKAISMHNLHGAVDGSVVTQDNQHLFRAYRNAVSGNAATLIAAAKRAAA